MNADFYKLVRTLESLTEETPEPKKLDNGKSVLKESTITEMDKSQPSSDRGGESSGDPYAKGGQAKPVKFKDMAKHAEKTLNKSMDKAHKKDVKEQQQGVAEGTAVPWQVVINALASGYPDLDPTDSLRPIMRKYGVDFDDLNLLARRNGYNDIYAVLDEFGQDQGVAEGSLNEGQYEMMMRNGQVKKFIAKDDADAKRIAAGHGAKSVIRLKGGVPAGKVSEQGVVEGSLKEVSLDLAKRARDKAEYFVDMDYDDLRAQPYGYSEKQRKKFQRYIDRKEPRAKGDRDWDPPNKGVAEGGNIGGEPYDMEASLRGKSVDELNSLIKKLEGKPASHADAHKLVAAAKKIRAEKIGKKNVSEEQVNEKAVSRAAEGVDTGEYDARKTQPSSKQQQDKVFAKHKERVKALSTDNDTKKQGVAEGQLKEVAPPGAKAERMVKHIKAGYAKDGKLSDKEKSIAYATTWKAHNKGKVEEGEVWRPGMPPPPNPDMGSSLTPREQRRVVTPQGPDGVQQPHLPQEPKKPAQPKRSEIGSDTDVAETAKQKNKKSDRLPIYQESARYKTINKLIREEFDLKDEQDRMSIEEKDLQSSLGDELFNQLQAVQNGEAEMSESLKDALFNFYKSSGELPPEVSNNEQDITEYIKDRIMSMSSNNDDDRLPMSEDTKHKGTRYGGSAQVDDEDDEDGEAKTKAASTEKRGRGRPRKDSGDANTNAKYSGAKDLQSFMVGNVPKKSKSLEKLPTTKHKIKG